VADSDGRTDVSEVASEVDKGADLSAGDESLSSASSKHLAEDPTSRSVSAKKNEKKQSSVLTKDQRSVERLDHEDKTVPEQPCEEETVWDITVEVFLPFIVAGLGMVTTGITLSYVKVSTLLSCCGVSFGVGLLSSYGVLEVTTLQEYVL